jgi:hypothetical protein
VLSVQSNSKHVIVGKRYAVSKDHRKKKRANTRVRPYFNKYSNRLKLSACRGAARCARTTAIHHSHLVDVLKQLICILRIQPGGALNWQQLGLIGLGQFALAFDALL